MNGKGKIGENLLLLFEGVAATEGAGGGRSS